MVTTRIRLRFECNSTALRPFDELRVTTGLMHCGLKK